MEEIRIGIYSVYAAACVCLFYLLCNIVDTDK